MKNYDVIIFDLDGTLSNSKEGITKSVQYALNKLGIIEEDLDKLEHFIGPPLKEELMISYNLSEEDAIKGVEYYREYYIPTGIYETESYDGTKELLQKLKNAGKYIAMATSKPQGMAEEVIKYLGIDMFFDKIMGAELHGPRQSKTAVLQALFDELNVDYVTAENDMGVKGTENNSCIKKAENNSCITITDSNCVNSTDKQKIVMIGDTCFDVEGANNMGIDSIGVGFGFGSKDEMLEMGAKFVADNNWELADYLLKCDLT